MSENSEEVLPDFNEAMTNFTNDQLRFERDAEVKSSVVFALFCEFLRTHNPRLFMDFNTQKFKSKCRAKLLSFIEKKYGIHSCCGRAFFMNLTVVVGPRS